MSLKGALAGAGALLVVTASVAARADGKGDTCATAYEEAQQHLRAHSPLRARADLRLCLSACPTVLARDCSGWLTGVDPEIASIRVVAEAADGTPARAEVTVDDGPVVPAGTIEIDPGEHRVVGRDGDGGVAETKITVRAGERDVPVRLRFPAPPPKPALLLPPPPVEVPRSRAPIVLVIAGGVGLAAGGVLGVVGQVEKHHLETTCAPRCKREQLDPIRAEWITGGAVATAGLLAAVSGVVWLATSPARSSTVRPTGQGIEISF